MLYNRDPFLMRVGEMVGLHYFAERRLPLPKDDAGLSVLLPTGVHGSGGTAVLDALAQRYRNRTPFGYLDLTRQHFAESAPAAAGTQNSESPLIRLLHNVIWDLTRQPRDTSALQTPRLLLALLVISLWPPGTPLTVVDATQRARAASTRLETLVGGDAGDERARDFRDVFVRVLTSAALPVPHPIDTMIVEAATLFVDHVLVHRQRNAVRAWWRRYGPGAGTGEEKVLEVARDFHAGGDHRERAEAALVAAFLADVAADFGDRKHWRSRRPLLLIDNLCADGAGPLLLDLVLRNRTTTPDPLVLVATVPPHELRRWPTVSTVPIEEVPAMPGPPLTAATLTPLRWPGDALQVFDASYRDPTKARSGLGDLRRVVHRLADGLPLAVVELAAAVAREQESDRAVDPAHLLDLPAPDTADRGPRTTADRLLPLLVPDREIRAELVLFAAAPDAGGAAVLAGRFLPGPPAKSVRRVERFLIHETRPRPDAGFLVGDPLLRAVLLHRLRAHGAVRGTASTVGWAEVHGCLHAHYAAAAVGATGTGPLGPDEPLRLRHALSLGRESQTVDRLVAAFPVTGQRDWLAALVQVVAAPGGGAAAAARLPAPDDSTAPDRTHRAIARLLRNAWYLGDPLTPPDPTAIKRLGSDLEVLAGEHPSDGEVFFDAATDWSAALMDWRQDAGWLDTGGGTS